MQKTKYKPGIMWKIGNEKPETHDRRWERETQVHEGKPEQQTHIPTDKKEDEDLNTQAVINW